MKTVYFDAVLCIRKQNLLQFKKKKNSQISIKLNIEIWYGCQHAEDKKGNITTVGKKPLSSHTKLESLWLQRKKL